MAGRPKIPRPPNREIDGRVYRPILVYGPSSMRCHRCDGRYTPHRWSWETVDRPYIHICHLCAGGDDGQVRVTPQQLGEMTVNEIAEVVSAMPPERFEAIWSALGQVIRAVCKQRVEEKRTADAEKPTKTTEG